MRSNRGPGTPCRLVGFHTYALLQVRVKKRNMQYAKITHFYFSWYRQKKYWSEIYQDASGSQKSEENFREAVTSHTRRTSVNAEPSTPKLDL